MQFFIAQQCNLPDLAAVESLLRAADPAAIVDQGEPEGALRVSTCMTKYELIDVLHGAGMVTRHDQVIPLRSECCGGCGG